MIKDLTVSIQTTTKTEIEVSNNFFFFFKLYVFSLVRHENQRFGEKKSGISKFEVEIWQNSI